MTSLQRTKIWEFYSLGTSCDRIRRRQQNTIGRGPDFGHATDQPSAVCPQNTDANAAFPSRAADTTTDRP